MICARCGKRVQGPVVEGLCLNCFLETRSIPLSYKLEIEQCPLCGRYRVAGRWVDSRDRVDEWARERLLKAFGRILQQYGVSIEEVSISASSFALTLNASGRRAVLRGDLEITVGKTLCPLCIRSKTEAFEALVQVRASSKEDLGLVKALVERALQTIPEERAAEVLDVEELEEGIDVKTLSHTSARLIANQIKHLYPAAEVKETHKVVGIKGGRRRSKLTVSVRLLRSSCYAVVGYEEGPALVEFLPSGRVSLRTWRGTKEVLSSREFSRRARPFKGVVREAVVLETSGNHVLVTVNGLTTSLPLSDVKQLVTRGTRALLVEDEAGRTYLFPIPEGSSPCEGL